VNSRRAWLVLAIGTFAYLVSVTQRSTFGVAGVAATERFTATAAALSTVAVLQIAVYAILQIPVGLLIDRFGSRRILAIGAVCMAAGQVVVAIAPILLVAGAGRVLVGLGDAFTFLSVIRLLPGWFDNRRLPMLVQWVATIGALGQIIAAYPFAILLRLAPWQSAFLIAAAASALAAVLVLLFVRAGEPLPLTSPVPTGGTPAILRASLRRPGTQLGFWSHMLLATPANAFAFLWGYPLLTVGLGFPTGTAAIVMAMLVAATFLGGPVIGWMIARFPMRRSNVVITVAVLSYGALGVLLIWPGRPPLAALIVAFLFIGIGGPGSMIGLDFARTFNPSHAGGVASGIVNTGGFTGGFVSLFLIGLLLDLRAGHGAPISALYAWEGFRVALLAVVGIGLIALVMLLLARRRTRARMFLEDGIIIAPFWVALFRRLRGRGMPPSVR
jgi:MFS family permease